MMNIGILAGRTLTLITMAVQYYILELTRIVELWGNSLPVQESTSLTAHALSYVSRIVRMSIIGSLS